MTTTTVDLPTVTVEDVQRTARDATHAQWTVAGIGMAGSALAAYFAIDALGEIGVIGVAVAATADLALIRWLRIAKRLRAYEQRCPGGFLLEAAAGFIMLYQNLGAAVFPLVRKGSALAHWLLGVEHVFIPVLMILVTVAFEDASHKLNRLLRQARAAETTAVTEKRNAEQSALDFAAEAAQLRRERDDHRTESERRGHRISRLEADLAQQTTATRTAAAELEEARAAQQAARPQPAAAVKPARTVPADRETRRQWVRQERSAGRKPTGADVDKRFGPPRNGAAVVREVLAEEKNRLHVVGGKR